MDTSRPPVVLITGAGTGIGRATAEMFLRDGWCALLVGRKVQPLENIARAFPNQALAVTCDVQDKEQVETLALRIKNGDFRAPFNALLPKALYAVINNAGVYERVSFLESSDEIWQRQIDINVMGTVRVSRALAPLLIANGRGTIVNVSSTVGQRPVAMTAAYSATKAAVINLTQTMALELAPHNVRANCVCPGIVDTPIHGFHDPKTQDERQMFEAVQKLQPLGRIGQPKEIAAAVRYFCSSDSEWTTGSILNVDGGISLV